MNLIPVHSYPSSSIKNSAEPASPQVVQRQQYAQPTVELVGHWQNLTLTLSIGGDVDPCAGGCYEY